MILLLSGPAAAGKTTICESLTANHGFAAIKSSRHLRTLVQPTEREVTREVLQEIGDRLDVETDFNWLVTDVAIPQIDAQQDQKFWFVDSVRKPEQIDRFSEAFPGKVLHCHVTAPDSVLRFRMQARDESNGSLSYEKDYAEHVTHPNEVSARALGDVAKLVIDTSRIDALFACDTIMKGFHELCREK